MKSSKFSPSEASKASVGRFERLDLDELENELNSLAIAATRVMFALDAVRLRCELEQELAREQALEQAKPGTE